MANSTAETEKVVGLITEAIKTLCAKEVKYDKGLTVEGVLNIVVDEHHIFQISICETIQNINTDDMVKSAEQEETRLDTAYSSNALDFTGNSNKRVITGQ